VARPPVLKELAEALSAGTAIGASDGSVRQRDNLSSHAWILHAGPGCELSGKGPVDGLPRFKTSHRAELQGQAALFIMISLLAQFYNIISGTLTTFCDNQPVVRKLQKGWQMFRLRHTKGPDSDLQIILRSTLESLRKSHGIQYKIEWIPSHQDKDTELTALPRHVALNVRMDADTKLAYNFDSQWLSQDYVPVFKPEGCAIYIDNHKVISSLSSSLLDKWHETEARKYLSHRHGINDELFQTIHWPALKFALMKFSHHRRATAVKSLHRHLPTQQKLFAQGRVTMSSMCPRCITSEETNAHIYCCTNDAAVKQRREDLNELLKQLSKIRTSQIIIRAWKEHLLPLLGLPSSVDITTNAQILCDDHTAYLLK